MKFTNLLLSILLLSAVLVTGCGGANDNSKTQAQTRMKQLGLLLLNNAFSEGGGFYPDMSSPQVAQASLQSASAKKGRSAKEWDDTIFIHPSSGQPFIPNAKLSNMSIASNNTTVEVIAFYAPEPDGDERLVCYLDGHVEWVKEEQWPLRKTAGLLVP